MVIMEAYHRFILNNVVFFCPTVRAVRHRTTASYSSMGYNACIDTDFRPCLGFEQTSSLTVAGRFPLAGDYNADGDSVRT
jgi:hypothetical protein